MWWKILVEPRVALLRVAVQFFFSSRRRHTRLTCDWSSDVCSSDLEREQQQRSEAERERCRLHGVAAHVAAQLARRSQPRKKEQRDEREREEHRERRGRSEERRVGKEGRSRGEPEPHREQQLGAGES